MDKQIDSLRVSQAEKQLELREAATKRKLLALKQQLSASRNPTSDTASPISPCHTHYTPDSSTRNGMSALRARLMASQDDSNWDQHTASGSGRRTDRREGGKDSTLPCTQGKEAEFMSVAQQQKERVERIRRAMHAATVIQRAWRRHRSGV